MDGAAEGAVDGPAESVVQSDHAEGDGPQEDDARTELQEGLATASVSPRRPPGGFGGGGDNGVTFDLLLSDLEAAEEAVYGKVFVHLPGGTNGLVKLDCEELRSLVVLHTSVEETELETELLKTGALDDGGLSSSRFVHFMRNNAVAETLAIEEFLGMSKDGVTVSAQDCRSRLQQVGQRKLAADFPEARWDRLLNVVMTDADIVVPMEVWITFCKQTARTIRVAKLGDVK
eukprot:CAMPEP_0171101296 /NCGR_PEP_ID=MMETSP0766_2-20121228/54549_1 /TAXON_ID=439317 /ORGANISM="Gambierdiscus australes, Strain CAWD 149" /LENGTH=230 /DNA_ID=CAMNT_0011561311 /DNA_START=67 /DNA_END=759 /DNA_ORIENTATION=+